MIMLTKMNPIHKCLLISLLLISQFACRQEIKQSKPVVARQDTLQPNESQNPYTTFDQSPMDMSYYPPQYPILKMNGTDTQALMARVIYSRPKKKGRMIFGTDPKKSLREYGKEWRLGANEATEIEFFRDASIAGKKISKGRYIIYCIPYPDRWTIILNSNLYTWGLHMDPDKDIFKTDIPVREQSPRLEDFTMVFEKDENGPCLIMAWDNIRIVLPISFR
jgi:hypothetical protein